MKPDFVGCINYALGWHCRRVVKGEGEGGEAVHERVVMGAMGTVKVGGLSSRGGHCIVIAHSSRIRPPRGVCNHGSAASKTIVTRGSTPVTTVIAKLLLQRVT